MEAKDQGPCADRRGAQDAAARSKLADVWLKEHELAFNEYQRVNSVIQRAVPLYLTALVLGLGWAISALLEAPQGSIAQLLKGQTAHVSLAIFLVPLANTTFWLWVLWLLATHSRLNAYRILVIPRMLSSALGVNESRVPHMLHYLLADRNWHYLTIAAFVPASVFGFLLNVFCVAFAIHVGAAAHAMGVALLALTCLFILILLICLHIYWCRIMCPGMRELKRVLGRAFSGPRESIADVLRNPCRPRMSPVRIKGVIVGRKRLPFGGRRPCGLQDETGTIPVRWADQPASIGATVEVVGAVRPGVKMGSRFYWVRIAEFPRHDGEEGQLAR